MEFIRQYWGLIVFLMGIIAALMADHLFIQSIRNQVKTIFDKLDALKTSSSKTELELTRLKEHISMMEKYVIKIK